MPGLRAALEQARAPIVAVSPIIGGAAVKGPTAKLMVELGLTVSNDQIAAHYAGLIDGLLIDEGDDCAATGIAIGRAATLMRDSEDKRRVALAALRLAEEIGSRCAGPRSSR